MQTQNKLCIFFLVTYREIITGELLRAVKFYNTYCDSKYSFDLKVFVDDIENYNSSKIQAIKSHISKFSHVSNIEFINNNILKELNILLEYESDVNIDLNKHALGKTHGINQHFYAAMEYMFSCDYENFLLLETDTKPTCKNWLNILIDRCDNEQFSILGSTYKGLDRENQMKEYYGPHLNGVAVYKNSKKCEFVINSSKQFIIDELKRDVVNMYRGMMNYDVAIYLYCKSSNNLRGVVDCNIITNVSSFRETDIREEYFMKQYPDTVIMHKKKLYTN